MYGLLGFIPASAGDAVIEMRFCRNIREAPEDAPSEAESAVAIGRHVSRAVELFSQAFVLSLELFYTIAQRRKQNLDFIRRELWRDVL
jgi:hypothetical protein